MDIRKVGVVGCGLMGAGIAQVAAQAGYDTTVRELNEELLEKGLGRISAFLEVPGTLNHALEDGGQCFRRRFRELMPSSASAGHFSRWQVKDS